MEGLDNEEVPLSTIVAVAVIGLAASLPAFAQKSSDRLTNKQVKELVATAKTPADHVKLQKHFLAVAAKYEADAGVHAAEAEVYRKNPALTHDRTVGGHCERLAEVKREAAKEARDLAAAHEHMAAEAK